MHVSLPPAALAKAKALGIVAAALTAGGAGGMVALNQVSNATPAAPVTISADSTRAPKPEPTQTPTATPTPSDTGSQAAAPQTTSSTYALPTCPADVNNHGGYVSSVATTAPKGAGGEHGGWVSQGARSDCGKPAGAGGGHDSAKPKASPTHRTPTAKPTVQRSHQSDGQQSDGQQSEQHHGSGDSHVSTATHGDH